MPQKINRPQKNWRDILKIFDNELLGGVILIVATIFALLVANSALHTTYFSLWHTKIGIKINEIFIGLSLHEWINDVLMALFFLMVGLEIKREFLIGELNSLQKAAFPVVAALGGMLVPAVIFYALNFSTPSAHGFGIPMATDIAFAMGVILLLGKRVPVSLKIFLVTLAVVDDLGAILVIAIFYTTGSLSWLYFVLACGVLAILATLNFFKVQKISVYLFFGVFLWLCVLKMGVHPTISAVLLAFFVPLRAPDPKRPQKISPLQRLEHSLHGISVYFIMPLFAFANAGVSLGFDVDFGVDHVFLGVFLGLLVGKPLGIFAITFFCDKIGIAKKPESVNFAHIIGAGLLAGIGFTMSIFISNLTFHGAGAENATNVAKIAILSASLLAAIIGSTFLLAYHKIFTKEKNAV